MCAAPSIWSDRVARRASPRRASPRRASPQICRGPSSSTMQVGRLLGQGEQPCLVVSARAIDYGCPLIAALQIDLLDNPAIDDVVVLSVVLGEVKNKNLPCTTEQQDWGYGDGSPEDWVSSGGRSRNRVDVEEGEAMVGRSVRPRQPSRSTGTLSP